VIPVLLVVGVVLGRWWATVPVATAAWAAWLALDGVVGGVSQVSATAALAALNTTAGVLVFRGARTLWRALRRPADRLSA
jgi:hypothetical protein